MTELKAWAYLPYRLLIRMYCGMLGFVEVRRAAPAMPLPPPMLRFRVAGTPSRDVFDRVGRESCQRIVALIEGAGRNIREFPDILDFGCGCGRTIRWLAAQLPEIDIQGIDIDAEAIQWCLAHLRGHYSIGSRQPPLPYASHSIGLLYAISVFTHIDEESQLRWLREFRRVLRPDGLLIVTVHGSGLLQGRWGKLRGGMRSTGIIYAKGERLRGFHPDWYQTTFHEREYTERTFRQIFPDVRYHTGGMGHQDAIVLRNFRPAHSGHP